MPKALLSKREFGRLMSKLQRNELKGMRYRYLPGQEDDGNGLPVCFYLPRQVEQSFRLCSRGNRKCSWEVDGAMNCVVAPRELAATLPVRRLYTTSKQAGGIGYVMDGAPTLVRRELNADVSVGILDPEGQELFVQFMRDLQGFDDRCVGIRTGWRDPIPIN